MLIPRLLASLQRAGAGVRSEGSVPREVTARSPEVVQVDRVQVAIEMWRKSCTVPGRGWAGQRLRGGGCEGRGGLARGGWGPGFTNILTHFNY